MYRFELEKEERETIVEETENTHEETHEESEIWFRIKNKTW